jgi:multiple sugar transport system permease protein
MFRLSERHATVNSQRHPARAVGFYSSSTIIAAVFLLPMIWTALSSVRGRQSNAAGDPSGFGFDNFKRLWEYGSGAPTYLLNTATVALITVAVTVVATTLGGYAMARFQFPFKNLLFVLTLAILMVPYTSLLIPLYVFLGWIRLQNSLIGLGLVLAMLQMPFGLFMMRNSFEAIPRELDEAATIDGSSSLGVLLRVLLPGVLPGVITVALFSFLASWNEFVAPLVFLTSGDKFTLPVALFNLQSGSNNVVDFGALQSGVVTAAIPCVLVFLLLQRYYIRGFSAGALKG